MSFLGSHLTTAELCLFFQASISKQKSALQKHSVIVKTQQKELQTATLELGVCGPFFFAFLGGQRLIESHLHRTE